MFRNNEIAFVYVYKWDVDISKLSIQKEELDSAEWFNLEEVYNACQSPRDEKFCVTMGGLLSKKSKRDRIIILFQVLYAMHKKG